MRRKLFWIINVDSGAIGQLLIIFFIHQILEKKWEYNEAVHQLFIDFKKAYDSVRREALYNIVIEFGIPKKLVRHEINEKSGVGGILMCGNRGDERTKTFFFSV
jgi:hypothetical protein